MPSVAHINATIRLRDLTSERFEQLLIAREDDELWCRRHTYSGVQYRLSIDTDGIADIVFKPQRAPSVRIGGYRIDLHELLTCPRAPWLVRAREIGGGVAAEFLLALDAAIRIWPATPQPLKETHAA